MIPLLLALEVTQPVSLSVRTYAADVEVVAGARLALTVAGHAEAKAAVRPLGGTRYEAEFNGKRQLHDGSLRIEIPAGSSLDIGTVTGRVSIAKVGGPARVRGMSGAVRIAGATDVDVETVDGGIEVENASGKVRIHTTSGTSSVSAPALGDVEMETASGAAVVRGSCAARCHIDVDSVSAEVRFGFAPESSFATSITTTSGHVRDTLGLGMSKREAWTEGRFHGGDGEVECETFSGDIVFAPR